MKKNKQEETFNKFKQLWKDLEDTEKIISSQTAKKLKLKKDKKFKEWVFDEVQNCKTYKEFLKEMNRHYSKIKSKRAK